MPSLENLQYLCGQADGDGCITIFKEGGYGSVRLDIHKTIKSITTLEWCRDTFGGCITNFDARSERNTQHSDTLTWQVKWDKAVQLCKVLAPHSQIKRDQFEMAAAFPHKAIQQTRLKGVMLTDNSGQEHSFDTSKQAAVFLACTPQAICYALKHGSICKGYSVKPSTPLFTPQQVKQLVDQMHLSLQFMKRLPDDPVPGPLPLPYVAGFFDAEGSLSIQGNDCRLSISQKFPAIRDALQHQFGGRSHGIAWYANSCWREFCELILPYSIEKRAQLELVLSMNGNGAEIKAKLSPLQRNKRKLAVLSR